MARSHEGVECGFFFDDEDPFQAAEEDVFDMSYVGYEDSTVVRTAVNCLAVVLENTEAAVDKALCSCDNIQLMARYVESVGKIVDIAVDHCLFNEEFWIAVVDVPGNGISTLGVETLP